jgi:acyl-CoA thioester hydrolase
MPVTTHQVRVRYAETDQMGIVYYANYLVWFELGRVELLRSSGARLQPTGDRARVHLCRWLRRRCRYRSPARYDDEILIETRPALLRGSVIKFAYRILAQGVARRGRAEALLAEGETVHVVCDDQLNKKPLPEHYVSGVAGVDGGRVVRELVWNIDDFESVGGYFGPFLFVIR